MAGRRGLRQARRRSHRRLRQDHRPWTYPRSPSTPSLHKAPCGGEGTGPNPTDRAKIGWKWSIATDLLADPHRLGHRRREPQRQHPARTNLASRRRPRPARRRPDPAPGQGLRQLAHHPTLPRPRTHRRRLRQEDAQGRTQGHHFPQGRTQDPEAPTAKAKTKKTHSLGLRWPVERTNSWFSNFGQLRRNTDRFSRQRLGQVALAVALILTVKLVKWAKRWTD